MAVNALKKITVRDVMKGKPEKAEVEVSYPAKGDEPAKVIKEHQVIPQDVCIIYGRAHSHETGSTQFGNYVSFIGSFEARRIKDGEIFQSTRIIFPPIADGIALEAYMNAKNEDPTCNVDFAFVVGVEHDARGAEGFKFTCKPVNTGANTSDPLAELRSSLGPKFLAAIGADKIKAIGFDDAGADALKIGEGTASEPAKGKAKATA